MLAPTTDVLIVGAGPTRRPIAQHVVALTDRMTRAATLRNVAARTLRNTVIGLISAIPAVTRAMAFELAELRYR